ncbi:sulfatase-like hydrolase/transferase [Halogeometricum sp. S1BR25-6]|uniref:Sulfatase-like hydrolase/transferase n=1 Tax=Halogeometricum salsisoli TaxID=2950536 RepID=A0ABU2GIN8_9EURY|nr:sulfatase-like hydrolase/transferase [Halogeometricum sp. S1BR25-6]MDS0300650.1 sulfatase-like hydrolase/transferase [Halogeometricum sp. S1BR25-6]
MPPAAPNVLFVMTDQQRFDTIRALGNDRIHTPNIDRLVARGVSFTNAYSTTPICIPARHTIRTGCDALTTGYFGNEKRDAAHLEDRCGPFLARRMGELGYRTFLVGKYHAHPRDIDLGYDTRLSAEAYRADTGHKVKTTAREGAMIHLPQRNALPRETNYEAWMTDRAVDLVGGRDEDDDRPFFGLVSYEPPHPPFAPSPPFDRMYDPDRLSDPVEGELAVDHMDEKIPAQNHHFWTARGNGIDRTTARVVKAHYYGMVSEVDRHIGRLLDAVEARDDAENTVVCFFSDHGEMLGDHRGWEKTSFFESSCRVPFLVSWPAELPEGERCEEFVSLTDLFGIATTAAGSQELRDGVDVLGMLRGDTGPRERLFGYHRTPRLPPNFTAMVREGDWKYVFMRNGGREQLFDLSTDPNEVDECAGDHPEKTAELRESLAEKLTAEGQTAFVENGTLRRDPYREIDMGRLVREPYPASPADVLGGDE